MKVIPAMIHYICTGYGISTLTCSSKSERTARTGQGNIVSGEGCKAKSYFIFKEVKNTNNRVIIILLIIQNKIQRTNIGFINDTNFYSNREEG